MLRFNPRTNRLEPEEHMFPLVDPDEPELFRDIFSYTSVPEIPFNYRLVPMQPPDEMWITDTTFRDGQQARPPYTPKQIADLYEMMHHLGGPNGMIRQSEFFIYSEKDRKAVELCREKGFRYPEITAWIRARREDFKLVKQMGFRETGILTSCSDYHIFLKLKMRRKQALEMYLDIVRAAIEEGILPRCHLEDLTRADFYNFVIPFVKELMKLSEQSGTPIKIRACDTMGYGVPYPGASLPRSVPGIIYGLTHHAGVPPEWLEWHGHNDFHKVLVNAATAWLYGCAAANGTLLGIGERTGNPPIEGLVIEYISLRGTTNRMDTTVITDIADYYRKELGYEIPPQQPLVGSDFNVTRAGIHADGMLKSEEIYNIFDTEKVLKRSAGIGVTDKSGVAGIGAWIDTYVAAPAGKQVDKKHPGLVKIKDWVDAEYAAGRVTAISNEELLAHTRQHLPELFE